MRTLQGNELIQYGLLTKKKKNEQIWKCNIFLDTLLWIINISFLKSLIIGYNTLSITHFLIKF